MEQKPVTYNVVFNLGFPENNFRVENLLFF